MRTRVFVRALASLATAAALLLPALPAVAQNPAANASTAPQQVELNVDVVLRDGQELERQKKWADAFSLYDDALERFPEHAALKHRFTVARMHYDLGRRYADASYTKSVRTMAEGEALRLYSEVMLKLHTHYVDTPDWRHVVNQGTLMLEVALTDDVFLKNQLPDTPIATINEYRRDLRNRLAARTIRSRHDARDAVSYAAWLADRRLGLSQNAAVLEYTCGRPGPAA